MTKAPIDDRFAKLRAAKTLPDFESAIKDIREQVAATEARREGLDAELQDAVFDAGDTARINKAIATADDDLRTLRAALAGAMSRRDEAEELAAKTTTEELIKEAAAVGGELSALRVKLHGLLAEAQAVNIDIDRVETERLRVNASLEFRGASESRTSLDRQPGGIEPLNFTAKLSRKHCREFDRLIVDLDRGNNVRRERSQRSLKGATQSSLASLPSYGGGLNGSGAARQKGGNDPLRAWR